MKLAVMGFGNPVRSDDAIGIHVIQKLKEEYAQNRFVSIFDMGTAAFEVLFGLKGHQKIILVDAVVNSNEPVGSIFKVPAEEVLKAPENNPMVFLHSMKWNQALSYAKKILLEDYPDDIQVYLIAIENTRLEIQLSDEVSKSGEKVIKMIREEINQLHKIE